MVVVNEETAVVFVRVTMLRAEQAACRPTFLDVVAVLLWIADVRIRQVHLLAVNLNRYVIVIESLRARSVLGLPDNTYSRYLMARTDACCHELCCPYGLVARNASEDYIPPWDCGADILDSVRSSVNWCLVRWVTQIRHRFGAGFRQSLRWRLRFIYR